MIGSQSIVELGNVTVKTVSSRGFTPEELAEQALDKIIYVGGNCHPAIQEQAEAFVKQYYKPDFDVGGFENKTEEVVLKLVNSRGADVKAESTKVEIAESENPFA